MEDERVDKIIGLKGVKDAFAFFRTPDGEAAIELIQFYRPVDEREALQPLANTPGIRHIAFVVEDIQAIVARLKERGTELVGEIINYDNMYKLCYIRGPEGIILELTEQVK